MLKSLKNNKLLMKKKLLSKLRKLNNNWVLITKM